MDSGRHREPEPGAASEAGDDDVDGPTAQAIEELLSRIAASVAMASSHEPPEVWVQPEASGGENPLLLDQQGPAEPAP